MGSGRTTSTHTRRLVIGLGLVVVLASILLLRPGSSSSSAFDLPDEVDFNYHIRPILSNNCYVCHGPDPSTREADLRLDLREGAIAKREEGGRAIVPGSARRSLLIHRVTAEDPDHQMPPAEMNKTLSPYEVALLRRWIDQGATYKKHWSLIPPANPDLPRVSSSREGATTIDRFVRDQLQARGLAPAEPASKESVLRRLSFVLTGLPPAPDEVQAFVVDQAPEAYARWVDHYLASPHFGERWARHWMDLMRYADSKGHEFDFTIEGSWRYRDYLIRAFNADVPYDQFIMEHLAGDLLDTPRRHPDEGFNESIIGTNSLSLGEGLHSPVDVRKDEADRIDNIIDVTTKTFQGLTVSCARCHDHKFDPIPTTDYYALYGIFESTRFAPTALATALTEARLDSIQTLKATIRQQLAAQWLAEVSATPVQTVAAQNNRSPRRDTRRDSLESYQVLGDFRDGNLGGWYPHGPAFAETAKGALRMDAEQGRVLGLTEEKVSSVRWPGGLPGALRSPTFTIAHDTVAVVVAGRHASLRVIIDNFQLIRYPIFGGLEVELDNPALTTYRIDLGNWQGRKAYIELLQGTYNKRRAVNDQHQLVTTDSSFVAAAYAVAYTGTLPDVAAVLSPTPDPRDRAITTALQAWGQGQAEADDIALINTYLQQGRLRTTTEAVAPLTRQVQALTGRLGDIAYVQAVTEGDRIESPVFIRGNYGTPSEAIVPHRFLSAVRPDTASFTTTASGRLEFAQALADPANPLTARVMVNRLWHHLFGRGLVETVDNFGAQGKLPTHPALLDYLALRFVENGWSMKAMIREMVLSHTFRQATQPEAAAAQVDPENLLWHHYPVRRLEGEAIRDAMLVASGRFDATLYGPPVPIHLTPFMTGRGRPPVVGPLDGAGRRTLYTAVRRNFLSPMMLAFDMPIPFSTFGKRNTSNVPAQSLTLLNDPFVADQAAVWGDTLATMDLDVRSKIDHLFLTALSRLPSEEERADGVLFIEEHAKQHGLTATEAARDPQSWAAYGHVIFNLKEFIYLL